MREALGKLALGLRLAVYKPDVGRLAPLCHIASERFQIKVPGVRRKPDLLPPACDGAVLAIEAHGRTCVQFTQIRNIPGMSWEVSGEYDGVTRIVKHRVYERPRPSAREHRRAGDDVARRTLKDLSDDIFERL